ncbi:hypothetical protein KIN20_008208 [Parelaphostrongylus tenuis]|uniref:Dehydrogenase/reductase SDR family member 1 n=1 Tax=Parelaphostrongylus tenuis TaxID=148309 RepID=A0AAD5MQ48_PARTN|nr:hypothetical protein KIN20_008208 [Parelaphostrongylus tenuis]
MGTYTVQDTWFSLPASSAAQLSALFAQAATKLLEQIVTIVVSPLTGDEGAHICPTEGLGQPIDLSIMALAGQIAVVTGASRGIGRGVALQLGAAGATVYVTGRPPSQSDSSKDQSLPNLEKTAREVSERGGKGIAVYVDHSNMDEVKKFFERIEHDENGRLDILVNNAYAAVMNFIETHGKTFYECPPEMWDEVNNVGLRNHYYCSVYAARMMVRNGSGLIVNISSAGGLRYLFSVPYGVGKQALDRMAGDMAEELKTKNVCVVSIWPGAVRTELITNVFISEGAEKGKSKLTEMFERGETPEYQVKLS